MKIVIASDSFKETLSSSEVNDILAEATIDLFPEATIEKVLIADGGEGTIDCILSRINGEIFYDEVNGPLLNTKIKPKWTIINKSKDAILESALVIGLHLVPEQRRNPRITTSYGLGQLILHALDKKVESITIGLGGSSTNDGSIGIASALGVKFLDKSNNEIAPFSENLINLNKIDISKIDRRIFRTKIICLCDVNNMICGMQGASYTFAAQKGASQSDIILLEKALNNLVEIINSDLKIDISNIISGGAAGGIAGGLKAFLDAELKIGIESILEMINFKKIIHDADLIITGEGKIDSQTYFGKAIRGISSAAKNFNIPVIAFSGILEGDKEEIENKLCLKKIYSVSDINISKEESLENPKELLYKRALQGLKNYKDLHL